jgi:hypothetical protein
MGRTPSPITHHGARSFEDPLIAMTGNRSAVSATRMRAQITLFGVTIAFVPANQDCRAERRSRTSSGS